MSKSIVIAVLTSAVFCFGQEKQAKAPAFTLDDAKVMAQYFDKATIPARSDSTTMAAVQTLRQKLNTAFVTKSAKALSLTDQEKNIVRYMLGNDVADAQRVLALNSKLDVPLTAADKDTSRALAKK